MNKSRGLGKGLGALLGDIESVEPVDGDSVIELRITDIEPNKNQPRKVFDEEKLQTLADSIKMHGVIQPIIVKDLQNGYYQIIAGERRWRASRIAGLKQIPAIVRDYDHLTTMEIALIENLQREDLNPIEEALGYKALLEQFDMTQEKVSEKVSKSRSAIANSLRLLALPQSVQDLITDGSITSGHARAILSVESEELRELLAAKIISQSLNVRQAEALAKNISTQSETEVAPKPKTELDHQISNIQKRISETLGTKVKISDGPKKGKIEIEYYGSADLSRVLDLLKL